MTLLILFTGGFRVFTKGNWDPVGFVSSYLCVSFTSKPKIDANNVAETSLS
jgi:hypothetical protein